MLTDPANFPDLTMSGLPRDTHTPTFCEFAADHGFLPRLTIPPPTQPIPPPTNTTTAAATEISLTVRRAYHDQLHQRILTAQSYSPLIPTLLELHILLRSLVPNRTDLHDRLSDDNIDVSSTAGFLSNQLRTTAECLATLESEDRSVATVGWLASVDGVVRVVGGKEEGEKNGRRGLCVRCRWGTEMGQRTGKW